jgi:SpoVK/Ycf46/Vps4 family AAA+-type ATPase
VANRTDACFIRVIGSELVQKYVGEGARMVRELFEMARSKKVSTPVANLCEYKTQETSMSAHGL